MTVTVESFVLCKLRIPYGLMCYGIPVYTPVATLVT